LTQLGIVGALLALIHYNYKPEPAQTVASRPAPDDEDEF
jgi:PTS system mannose-specific IIC component